MKFVSFYAEEMPNKKETVSVTSMQFSLINLIVEATCANARISLKVLCLELGPIHRSAQSYYNEDRDRWMQYYSDWLVKSFSNR